MGPLQPAALAVMMLDPLHAVLYVTAPVPATMLLLPDIEAASRLYVIPVVLVAVAV